MTAAPKSKGRAPKRRTKPAPLFAPQPDHRAIVAARLDRQADFELHLGHHLAAERLAHLAADLREGTR